MLRLDCCLPPPTKISGDAPAQRRNEGLQYFQIHEWKSSFCNSVFTFWFSDIR